MNGMKITKNGDFYGGTLADARLPEQSRKRLLKLANEETAEELLELLDEAERVARPVVRFGVCPVEGGVVSGVQTGSELVKERLEGLGRCFPYVASCGRELEEWSERYADDFLMTFWADEIKKEYLGRMMRDFYGYIREEYRLSGHPAALNPGSLPGWPISGQRELFEVLGGREAVQSHTGVRYTDTFLMLPTKSVSGILFESETFYENCQYCPIEPCPNRRAKRIG